MIPVPWTIPALYLIAYALVGIAISVLTGIVASIALRLKIGGVIKDGLLGSLGFLVGFLGAAFMPWPQNTVTYYVGNTLVTSTMNSYQRPGRVGVVIATLLPLLHGLYRFRRKQS